MEQACARQNNLRGLAPYPAEEVSLMHDLTERPNVRTFRRSLLGSVLVAALTLGTVAQATARQQDDKELTDLRLHVDQALLQNPRTRFPEYAAMDMVDWREEYHGH
jgi:hypothetical protein